MRRVDFVFCIGFEGSTAIIDGGMMRRHASRTPRQLAESGLFKQAVCAAVSATAPAEHLQEVLAVYNQKAATPVGSSEALERMFGVAGIPEGVKKVTVV